jgi:hypothetical protein
MEGYVKKSRDQPSVKELQTDLHATQRANESLRKDVTLIKNTVDSMTEILTAAPSTETRPKTYGTFPFRTMLDEMFCVFLSICVQDQVAAGEPVDCSDTCL